MSICYWVLVKPWALCNPHRITGTELSLPWVAWYLDTSFRDVSRWRLESYESSRKFWVVEICGSRWWEVGSRLTCLALCKGMWSPWLLGKGVVSSRCLKGGPPASTPLAYLLPLTGLPSWRWGSPTNSLSPKKPTKKNKHTRLFSSLKEED